MTEISDEPWISTERCPWQLNIHINDGSTITTERYFPNDFEPEDVTSWVMSMLNQPRPCWITIENVTFFTQAVSAVVVEPL